MVTAGKVLGLRRSDSLTEFLLYNAFFDSMKRCQPNPTLELVNEIHDAEADQGAAASSYPSLHNAP